MRLNVGVLGVVLLIVWSCNATLMSIDLGTEYLKVAAPKGTSIDVCLNEQSHRKSDTWIGFRGDDRFFGADARNFAPRFPDFMIPAVPRLVGVPYTSHTDDRTATWLADMHYTFPVTTNTARGSLNVSRYTPTPSNPHPPSFSADELMGMLFGYVKDQAERELSSPVRDAVLVVPSGFDSRQRQALVDAAAISGIRVLTFVHPTTAAVLQLGLQNRGFGESSVHVMMYDMGASKTEAAVYRIDPPRTDKDGSRLGGALGTITLMGSIAADMTLGGRTIDACLAEYLEDEYIKSHPKGRRVLRTKEQLTEQDRKSVASLMRAANRAKEMLSANRDAPVTVEGIEVGRDYSTRVTRATFETRCASLWERALRVRDAALTSAKVSLSSLDRFEVVGGGLRVPTLLERLSAGYRGGTVDRTLNSDEAMVVGAGYFGAALSGHFRMKTFKVVESLGRSVFASLTFENGTSTEERLLFSPTTKLPTRLRLRWNHTVGKTSVIITEGIDGGVRHKSSTTVVDVEKECSRFARHTNVTTSLLVDVRASEAGMVYVEKVVLDVHYFKNATRTVRITAKNDTLESGNASANVTNHTTGDTTYDANESGAQPDSSPQEDGMITDEDIPAPLDVAMTKQKPAEFAVETYYQARHQAVGMQTHTDFLSTPLPMSKEESLISRDLLRAMRQRDLLLLQRSAARNDLEAYIIWGLGDGFAFNTESHRLAGASEADVDGALTKLRDIQAWLEESGDNASTEELSAKLRQAKLIVRVALRDGEHTTQVEGVSVSEQEESALDADADMEDEL